MRILIITEEDPTYLPPAIDYVLSCINHNVAAVVCAKNPTTASFSKTAKRFIKTFGWLPLFKYAFHTVCLKAGCVFSNKIRHHSVKSVADIRGKPYRFESDVNSASFLTYVRDFNIDLIISVSSTQIFGSELISIPPRGCINIHTSSLPKYRGLYPVFWAMSHGDKSVGITVHYIEKGIDTGKIIIQKEMCIDGFKTMDQVLKASKIEGAKLLIEAVKLISSNKVKPKTPDLTDGSYYSFPTRESYKRFRKLGYKLW